jgi:hypothetical protein
MYIHKDKQLCIYTKTNNYVYTQRQTYVYTQRQTYVYTYTYTHGQYSVVPRLLKLCVLFLYIVQLLEALTSRYSLKHMHFSLCECISIA